MKTETNNDIAQLTDIEIDGDGCPQVDRQARLDREARHIRLALSRACRMECNGAGPSR
jgi:hypothetical protein